MRRFAGLRGLAVLIVAALVPAGCGEGQEDEPALALREAPAPPAVAPARPEPHAVAQPSPEDGAEPAAGPAGGPREDVSVPITAVATQAAPGASGTDAPAAGSHLQFEGTLQDALDGIRQAFGATVETDWKALAAVGIQPSQVVRVGAAYERVEDALDRVCEAASPPPPAMPLAWIAEDGVIHVSTLAGLKDRVTESAESGTWLLIVLAVVAIAVVGDAYLGLKILFVDAPQTPQGGPVSMGGLTFSRVVIGDHSYVWAPWMAGNRRQNVRACLLLPVTIFAMPLLVLMVSAAPKRVGRALHYLGGFKLMQRIFATQIKSSDISREWAGIGKWQH